MDNEKRRFTRIPFDVVATLQQDQQQWQTHVVDISLKGLLLEDDALGFDPQRPVDLTLTLSSHEQVSMQAQWHHKHNHCSGFNWISVDIDSLCHLRRLLEFNLGDDDQVAAEMRHLSVAPAAPQAQP